MCHARGRAAVRPNVNMTWLLSQVCAMQGGRAAERPNMNNPTRSEATRGEMSPLMASAPAGPNRGDENIEIEVMLNELYSLLLPCHLQDKVK